MSTCSHKPHSHLPDFASPFAQSDIFHTLALGLCPSQKLWLWSIPRRFQFLSIFNVPYREVQQRDCMDLFFPPSFTSAVKFRAKPDLGEEAFRIEEARSREWVCFLVKIITVPFEDMHIYMLSSCHPEDSFQSATVQQNTYFVCINMQGVVNKL